MFGRFISIYVIHDRLFSVEPNDLIEFSPRAQVECCPVLMTNRNNRLDMNCKVPPVAHLPTSTGLC